MMGMCDVHMPITCTALDFTLLIFSLFFSVGGHTAALTGKTIADVDMVLLCTGVYPNTSFISTDKLNEKVSSFLEPNALDSSS